MRKQRSAAIFVCTLAVLAGLAGAQPATGPATHPVKATITGQILDPDGKGLPGAAITFLFDIRPMFVRVVSDAEGKFKAELPVELARLSYIQVPRALVLKKLEGDVEVDDIGMFWWVNPKRQATAEIKIHLQEPQKRASGTVRDTEGKPVEGAKVWLSSRVAPGNNEDLLTAIVRPDPLDWDASYTAVTDKDGRYEVKVPFSWVQVVRIEGPPERMLYAIGFPEMPAVVLGESLVADATVTAGAGVEARVVDEDAKPVKGAQVQVRRVHPRSIDRYIPSSFTDEQGIARLSGVPAGPVQVWVRPPNDSGYIRSPSMYPVQRVELEPNKWGKVTLTGARSPARSPPMKVSLSKAS